MEGFSQREIKEARRARKLFNIAGSPSAKVLKYLIQSNIIKINPVTIENVKVANEIFGLQPSVVKGRIFRETPERVIDDHIEIPI